MEWSISRPMKNELVFYGLTTFDLLSRRVVGITVCTGVRRRNRDEGP